MNSDDRSTTGLSPAITDRRTIPRPLRRAIDFLHAGVFLALAGSLIGFAGSFDFRLDLFAHFRLTYAVALALGVTLALAFRQRRLALAWGLGFAVNFAAIAPLWQPATEQSGNSRPFSILRVQMVNVLRDNSRTDAVVAAIRQADPDVFLAVELDDPWLDTLKRELSDRWPHHVGQARGDAFGIALFSKSPLEHAKLFESPGSYAPSIRAEILQAGTRVTIFGTHPFPPVTRFNQDNWIEQMDDLARRVSGEPGNVVVIGDFNTTPWSENYRRFRKMTGLHDTMQGFGPQASWPSFVPYAGLPIDHVMVSPGIRTTQRRVGGFVGSDHFPVTADLEIPGG